MNDPGDLGGLHDILAPSDFPFWPLAPGVWVLIAALAAVLLLQIRRAWLRYRADAYRRAALHELDAIAALGEGDDADGVLRISGVLKRVALISYGRERTASLSGGAWAAFIADRSGPGTDVSAITEGLQRVWRGGEAGTPLRLLIGAAKTWVRRHRAAEGE